MKTNTTIQKEFDAVKFMRLQRDQISAEICNLSQKQILDYFKNRVPKERIIPQNPTTSVREPIQVVTD